MERSLLAALRDCGRAIATLAAVLPLDEAARTRVLQLSENVHVIATALLDDDEPWKLDARRMSLRDVYDS